MSRCPAWHITNGEAGWITGLFYAAYTVSVPILVTLTDRVDPRTVYLGGVALTIASHLGRCRPETAQGFRAPGTPNGTRAAGKRCLSGDA